MKAGSRWRVDPVLVTFVALALLIRLLFVLKIAPGLVHGDQDDYLEAARRLIDGQPMAFRNGHLFVRPPGFSLFIALIWKLTGLHTVMAVKVGNAFAGTAACAYIGALATLVTPRRLAARLAVLGAALYPYFIYYTSMCGTETLCVFFVVAGAYHLAAGLTDEEPRFGHVVAGATLLAVGNLVRAHVTVLWPVIGAWLAWRYWPRLRTIAQLAAALALPLVLVSLPWTIAVARQHLGTMFVTDGSGIYYYMGHNDDAEQLNCEPLDAAQTRALLEYGSRLPHDPAFIAAKAAPEGQQSAVFWRAGLAWDRAHLDKQPCLVAHKLWGYWRFYVNPAAYGRTTVAASLLALPVLLLGGLGMAWAWRRGERPLTTLVLLQVVAGTLSAVIFSTEVRYRIQALDGFFLAYAAFVVSEWWERRRAS